MNKLSLIKVSKRTITILAALIFMSSMVFAQATNSVNITVNIVPPYSPYYADYSGSNAGKVLLILQNLTNTQKTIKLAGQLEGDNGIKISTRSNYVPLQAIVLNPNETKQLNGLALKDIFDINTLNVYGVDKVKIIQTSRLPEGNYSFCLQALDYNNNQLLSASAPLGCTNISIAYPEPPILIWPQNSSAVPPVNPTVINFNWTNPGTVPMGTQYIIQMAAMPDNVAKDPNQLLNETSFPLLSQTVNGFSYNYTIGNLGLQPGKKYAWRVQAVDPSGKVVFKNNGFSAASVFLYGEQLPATQMLAVNQMKEISILIPTPDSMGKKIDVNNKQALYLRWKLINSDVDITSTPNRTRGRNGAPRMVNTSIEGTYVPMKYTIEIRDKATNKVVDNREALDMFYYTEKADSPPVFVNGRAYDFYIKAYSIKQPQNATSDKTAINIPSASHSMKDYTEIAGESKKGSFIYNKIPDTTATQKYMILAGTVKYKFDQYPEVYPVSGTLQLTRYYRQLSEDGKTVIKDNIAPGATEQTKFVVNVTKDGLFNAVVPAITPPKGLITCYRIDYPANNYYSSPEKVIELRNLSVGNVEVGEYISNVYSYNLNLHITKGYKQKYSKKNVATVSEAIGGLKVLLYRLTKGPEVPRYEGQDTSLNVSLAKDKDVMPPAVLVASGITKVSNIPNAYNEAVVSFNHLLCAINANDLYWIKVYDPKSNTVVINTPFNFRRPQKTLAPPVRYYTSYETLSDYSYLVEKNLTWTTEEAPVASVKGRLLYRYSDGISGAKPLANKVISLKPFIVLQAPGSNKTYALPLSKSDFLNLDGRDEPTPEDKKLFGYINGFNEGGSHPVTTNADGSFEFKDIPLWDSVFVSKGMYNFFFPFPSIPEPEKTNPAGSTLKDLWMAGILGNKDDADALAKAFKKMVEEDSKNPVRDEFDPQKIGNMTTIKEGVDITKKATTKRGGQLNTVENNSGGYQITNVQANVVKAVVTIKSNILKKGPAEIEEMSNTEVPLKDVPKGISAPAPCNAKVVYRIVVQDEDVYCSPDNNIEINPLQSLDAGILYSTVRTMRVKARVFRADEYVKEQGINNKQVLSIPAHLYNKFLVPGLKGEGETLHAPKDNNKMLLDKAVTEKEGITFNHLIKNSDYVLKAIIDEEANNSTSYQASDLTFNFRSPEKDVTTQLGKTFLFNDDFKEEEFDVDLKLQPDLPIIAGRVLNAIGTKGIASANVTLLVNVAMPSPFNPAYLIPTPVPISVPVDKNGYFSYKSSLFSGSEIRVIVGASGYKPLAQNDSTKTGIYDFNVSKMQNGQKVFKNLYFMPAASIKGNVINAKKEHIPALYKIEDIDYIEETIPECNVGQSVQSASNTSGKIIGNTSISGAMQKKVNSSHLAFLDKLTSSCKETFEAFTPMGAPAKLIIIPNDLKYFNDTLSIAKVTDVYNLWNFERVLTTREHRIEFEVTGPNKKPVKDAKIQILDKVLYTNMFGRVRVNFMNISESNFTVRITPPEGQNYIEREFTFTNEETKNFVTKSIKLSEGLVIGGTVSLNGAPVGGAEVYINNGGGTLIKTLTGNNGVYHLEGIRPVVGRARRSMVTIHVSGPARSSGTVLAQKQTIAVEDTQTANFDLTLLEDVNIRSLLGYDVAITTATPTADGYKLSGELNLGKAEGDFKVPDADLRIGFTDIEVKTSGRDDKGLFTVEPKGDIVLDNSVFKARFKDAYNARIMSNPDEDGMILKKLSPGTGVLNVHAKIVDNSFYFPSSYLAFKGSEFYFATNKGQLSNAIDAFSTEKNFTSPTYYFTNKDKGAIQFSLLQFPASTLPLETYFANGKIRLLPVITPSGINTLGTPLSINLPEILIDKTSVSQINGKAPLEFKLDTKWTVVVPKWEFSTEEAGIVALKNSANSIKTGVLDIPFSTFRLRNDILLIDNAKLNSINLGGIIPLNVSTETESTFGLDQKIGADLGKHYILRLLGKGGVAAGSIPKLTGFDKGIDIAAVTLVSNGEQYVDFAANSKSIKAFSLIDFQPLMIESSNNDFTIMGNVDLGIPRVQSFYGGFKYSSVTNVVPEFKAVKFDIGKGYVVFESPVKAKKTLTDGRFEFEGTVSEPNGQLNPINVSLVRDLNSTIISQLGVNTFDYGSGTTMDVSNATTSVLAKDKDWDYLTFTGRMRNGGKPMEDFQNDNPIPFKVYGEIACDDGELSVNSIGTPFGQMRLVFNWPKKELMGNLQIKDLDFGGVKMTGEAEVAMGANGFYMFAAGNVNFGVTPFSPVRAGLLIGRYKKLPKNVFFRAIQFNRNNKDLPVPVCGTEYDFKGMFVSGRKDLFEPFDFKMDLPPLFPLLSVGLSAEVGVDASLFLNFASTPEITLSVGAFGSVAISAASITGTSASGSINVDVTGRVTYSNAFKATFFSGLKLGYSVTQKIPLLPDIHKSGSLELSAQATFDTSAKDAVSFKLSTSSATAIKCGEAIKQ
ncbi:carboxypeptidase-like regulatory domain-containing protein [Pedobacter foliorum]|uniref:carboxypeptidase-like regulatory domain-containing protein n=1 Tax=Pedobacter foliorum TaxID=2739058 RepID=UPI001565C514|nr:carboxypeptidase-like regulatory domain-containing protein [Pedobacter foliorum]NRF39469.1 hypothetical protein [Pedobacter foliorum]